MRKVKVLVACGGGIATSTFAAEEIARIAEKEDIAVDIAKHPLADVQAIGKEFDICFVTSKYSRDIGCEVVSVSGLITGLDEEGATNKIKDALTRANTQVNG
jgi:PTS system galactitol-specific IIB component